MSRAFFHGMSAPRRIRRFVGAAIAVFVTLLWVPWAGAGDAPETVPAAAPAKSARTVAGLFAEVPEGAARQTAVAGTGGAAILRVVGATIFASLAAVGLVWAWRRWGRTSALPSDSGGLRVAGRVALTARHFVYELRVGRERILVGVADDRMCPLGVLADPPAKETAPTAAVPLQETRRVVGIQAPVEDSDLLPYRRQVNRLREILRDGGSESRETT
jgi:flagellar biogenesis protein FliO